ncbi:MAG: class I SAM-dependent methyltransferase [Holophaga sp.]|nr:class I SAM-dependent methyltransferase [Holophaga sp.]
MINTILMKLRPVAGGFDPVSAGGARRYADYEWDHFSPGLVDELELRVGGLAGKRVLDLGGGPGQYAIEFARRGARVTWHDISRNYLAVARDRAAAQGAELEFNLGYLEEAARYLDQPFDFIFNRICWYYCVNDAAFARLVHGLMRPGGQAYIDNFIHQAPGRFKPRYWLNAMAGVKIGHPVPPPGRLEKLFRSFGDLDQEVLQRTPRSERLLLTRR